MPYRQLASRIFFRTLIAGSAALIITRRDSDTGRSRFLNHINLATCQIYYYFGPWLRPFIDAEDAHRCTIVMARQSRLFRQSMGAAPVQTEHSNLETTPFDELSRRRTRKMMKQVADSADQSSASSSTTSAASSSSSSSAVVPSKVARLPLLKSTTFVNPIGLAAGFDKNAEAIDGLFDFGFGFLEIGSVTPLAQPGNPRPRVFRLEQDRAVINRCGFNSYGADYVKDVLDKRAIALDDLRAKGITLHQAQMGVGPVGVNLGKNKLSTDAIADYQVGVDKIGRHADYIVVNVSSPNTAGLRDLQQKSALRDLLAAVKLRRDEQFRKLKLPNPPLLVKIAPDLTDDDKDDIAEVCLAVGLDGMIISNTTIARPSSLIAPEQSEVGGLSGVPLKDVSTQMIRDMYKRTKGEMVIIGVGGIEDGADAYAKIKAGASLVQLYTAFAYGGPHQIHVIKQELSELVAKDGYMNISQAVGSDHRKAKVV